MRMVEQFMNVDADYKKASFSSKSVDTVIGNVDRDVSWRFNDFRFGLWSRRVVARPDFLHYAPPVDGARRPTW